MALVNPNLLRIAVPTPLRRYFDYMVPEGCDFKRLKPGVRVRVPFQRRELVGIYVETVTETDVPLSKLKSAIEVLDDEPVLTPDLMQLCQWAADYYHHPIGDVLTSALPLSLRQGKALIAPNKLRALLPVGSERNQDPLTLNDAQQKAVTAIVKASNTFEVILLNGITGSGKTEVYLQSIVKVLEQHQQVLVLVPEIGLTPQTIARFRERFSVPVVALHSKLTNRERLIAWQQAKSGEAKVVIGTRSAVFSAFDHLGLIIIDEEHDLSFKQQDGFRYHARDLAVMRAHFERIPIVLGSATPSLEVLHKATQGRYQHVHLPERAGVAVPPTVRLLDIRNVKLDEGMSPDLFEQMRTHLQAGNQVMLFLNRRGFAPVLMCHLCGWIAECQRCDRSMTYHLKAERLHCHHCDSRKPIPQQCGACGSGELHAIGLGTEKLEQALATHFPEYSIARIDRDSVQRKGKMEELLDDIQRGTHQILIGTQMLAKGHHFPKVTLVAIIDADSGFFSTDFRAIERMGQLLLQVSGRAGRVDQPGTVVIQTRQPEHPLLRLLVQEGYQAFAHALLDERQQAVLPPYTFFALFRAEARNINVASAFLQQIKKAGEGRLPEGVFVLGPIPAPMPRRAGYHRVQLLIQSAKRPVLHSLLNSLIAAIEAIPGKQQVRWSLDVDPLEMF